MRLTGLGKLVLLILAAGLAVGGYRLWQTTSGARAPGETGGSTPTDATPASGGSGGGVPSSGAASSSGEQGLLGRPLRVGVVTWPGYAGGIVAYFAGG